MVYNLITPCVKNNKDITKLYKNEGIFALSASCRRTVSAHWPPGWIFRQRYPSAPEILNYCTKTHRNEKEKTPRCKVISNRDLVIRVRTLLKTSPVFYSYVYCCTSIRLGLTIVCFFLNELATVKPVNVSSWKNFQSV